jgi:hypothetical protein
VRHVARDGEIRIVYRNLIGEAENGGPLGTLHRRKRNNIGRVLKETGQRDKGWLI